MLPTTAGRGNISHARRKHRPRIGRLSRCHWTNALRAVKIALSRGEVGILKTFFASVAGSAAVVAVCLNVASAKTEGELYDIDILLRQPHPFAGQFVQPPLSTEAGPVQIAPTAPAAAPPPAPTRTEPPPTAEGGGFMGVVSEIRFGALVHDEGPFSRNEEDGFNTNLELLFTPPDFLDVIWSPRPMIGITANSEGDTNQAYLGLSWEWEFLGDAFAGFSFGGAVHDGRNRTDELDRKELGCRVLFRESINVGYRFFDRHALMFHLDHISNGRLCSSNEGLENFGIRYGYRF